MTFFFIISILIVYKDLSDQSPVTRYVEPVCTNFASELCSPAWLVTSGVQEDDTKQIATMKMQQKSVKFNLACKKKPITLTVHYLELDMDAIGRFCKKDAEGHVTLTRDVILCRSASKMEAEVKSMIMEQKKRQRLLYKQQNSH